MTSPHCQPPDPPLTYADLPQVIAIERRAFPTPWSLAMFVLELSKPAGRLPGRAATSERLVGYSICSRYDTIWHLMNIAVDPDRRRAGIATRCCDELLDRIDDPTRAAHARGASLQRGRDRALRALRLPAAGMRRRYYQDNGEDALIMWRTPATLAGRSTTSRGTARARSVVILAHRDQLRRHLRRGRRRATARSAPT